MKLTRATFDQLLDLGLHDCISKYIDARLRKNSLKQEMKNLLAYKADDYVLVKSFPISDYDLDDLDVLSAHIKHIKGFIKQNEGKWVAWSLNRRANELDADGTPTEGRFIYETDPYSDYPTYGENWEIWASGKLGDQIVSEKVTNMEKEIKDCDQRQNEVFDQIKGLVEKYINN